MHDDRHRSDRDVNVLTIRALTGKDLIYPVFTILSLIGSYHMHVFAIRVLTGSSITCKSQLFAVCYMYLLVHSRNMEQNEIRKKKLTGSSRRCPC